MQSLRWWLGTAALWLLVGCGQQAVGEPCLPEGTPADGFRAGEVHLESSLQCRSQLCLVYGLSGDPRPSCVEDDGTQCASPREVEDHVYCSCRCDGAGAGAPECECPSGYSCQPMLDGADPGLRGSYCVKTHTVMR